VTQARTPVRVRVPQTRSIFVERALCCFGPCLRGTALEDEFETHRDHRADDRPDQIDPVVLRIHIAARFKGSPTRFDVGPGCTRSNDSARTCVGGSRS
jgi:hypothetical protein